MTTYSKSTVAGDSIRLKLLHDAVKSNTWLALGGTSPWPNEVEPPAPAKNLSLLPEVFALVYAHEVALVYEDAGGSLSYKGKNYSKVDGALSLNQVINAFPTALYFEAEIPAGALDSFAVPDYRMYGLFHYVEFDGYTPNQLKGEVVGDNFLDSFQIGWVSTFQPITVSGLDKQVIKILYKS